MPPENIDDLFRDKLDGHASPPSEALWSRLQAGAASESTPDSSAERLDQLFQQGLKAHATPPGRVLWERLEDEHLRPKKQRAAAWWPMAMAAALALLLVAGGAGLWLGFPFGRTQSGTVATQNDSSTTPPARPSEQAVVAQLEKTTEAAASPASAPQQIAANAVEPANTASSTSNQKNLTPQATRSEALASTAPKARMSAPGQLPRHLKGTNRQPDAATEQAPLVARTTTRPVLPAASTRPAAADEPRSTTETVVATLPKPASAPEIVPASTVPAASLASAGELITVDVRNGGEPVVRPSKMASPVATASATDERRRLGGRLLRQAGNLVRGERVSLAEAAGLPENVTVRATIAGHTLTKSIQL
ncbi:hypothetical protein I2I05_16005 [Hymenobacter sp. BT683]|uniref:Uncharacterized protein n=1 Tax=Hymenobacter jeongseonensis TaxID=2791027 RepID=A0ABS0IKK9_9BACT|nr:hypothetical protein [Hymenobacter jeongseonensis]MBF9238908.1 hypothetical protein [Hymenobacter jeongseonensis]